MNEVKPWYLSLGIWAAFVTVACGMLRMAKVEVDASLQRDVAEWLLSVATVVAGAAGLWGRWRARHRIGTSTAPPAGMVSAQSSGPAGSAA